MLEVACHALGLIYDPHIKLCMQSTSSEVNETLSLAQNIPMLIGEIMLYGQIHIVCNLAYDILLGRPFDIVLECIVHNFSNEDQTITIHNLNTGETATVLMFVDGCHPCNAHLGLDFCDFRI